MELHNKDLFCLEAGVMLIQEEKIQESSSHTFGFLIDLVSVFLSRSIAKMES